MIENPKALNDQAVLLASRGAYNDAIICFKRAITVEKDNPTLWYNLGVTYREAGNLKGAKSAFKKAFMLNSYDDVILEALSQVCFCDKDLDEAFEYCKQGLDYNPFNAHLWNTLGAVYFNMNDFTSATEAFEKAITIDPFYEDALFNLRDTYSNTGNITGIKVCEQHLLQSKK